MKNKIVVGILFVIAIFTISLGCFYQFDKNQSNASDNGENNNANVDNPTNDNTIKKTVCTYESVSSGVKTTETYTFNHQNDKLKSYSIVLKYEYSSETEESASRYKGDSIRSQVEAATSVEGIDITHTDENYVITNSYSYDLVTINALNTDLSSNISPIYNLDDSANKIIEEVKSWQFSCVNSMNK